MDATEQVQVNVLELKRARAAEFFELTKPRLNSLVLMTTFVGFYLAVNTAWDLWLLVNTLAGTFIMAGGASCLNQVWERSNDAQMLRTRNRPLPSGRIDPREATVFGLTLGLGGSLYLGLTANPLTGMIGLTSLLFYLLAYTPLKVRSPWNTFVGAISGAIPPVMGWTAVRNSVGPEAWVLFGILFLWQHPHFFALAWRLREDYARGGFKMVGRDGNGRLVGALMGISSLALIPVSAGLTVIGTTGNIYLVGSFVLGLAFVAYSLGFFRQRTDAAARKVFLMSLLYLTALIILMMADKIT